MEDLRVIDNLEQDRLKEEDVAKEEEKCKPPVRDQILLRV